MGLSGSFGFPIQVLASAAELACIISICCSARYMAIVLLREEEEFLMAMSCPAVTPRIPSARIESAIITSSSENPPR